MVKLKAQSQQIDKILIFFTVAITCFGVLMVYNASAAEAFRDFNDKLYYLKYQAIWAIIGLFLMWLTSLINYKWWLKISPLLLVINLIMLIAVLIPGIGMQIKGARRWLNTGLFVIQPSELAKLTFTLYLASWLTKKRHIWQFLLLISIMLTLVMLQPDMGTAVTLIATAFLTYFIAGAPLIQLLLLTISGFLVGMGVIFSSAYRRSRLLTFLNPTFDPLGSSYHIRQALIALGSGGLSGLGLGHSRQKYQYLPEAATDSIFAIIGEEIGFIGAAIVVIILFMLVYKIFRIAKKSPDQFAKLVAGGIACWIGIQVVINLSAMVGLIPLTGIPLPFISYGGSSLVVMLIAMGIILNISKYRNIKVNKS